jgi:hypothetical protein
MSLDVIKETKDFLSNNFEMKDLGEVDVILNINLLREGNGGITLVQSYYVEKVLSRFGYSECDCWGPSSSEGPQKHNLTIFSEWIM